MNILAPVEYILNIVFAFCYKVTENYGISLILMSFVITLGTYPLYHIADIWKQKETNIQNMMADDLKKINRAFTGQKKFYMTQVAYRIYNYKSWYAFRTSLGLLIQIPFFFAAYHVLSDYSGYVGHSFLFIQDLSKPDRVLYGINIMPIIMTIVNIVSAIIYSRSFKFKDNAQVFALAILFLMFLYNSPAALLIYWTMNNILSLLKSYFLNKDKKITFMDKKESFRLLFIVKLCMGWISLIIQCWYAVRGGIDPKLFYILDIGVLGIFICLKKMSLRSLLLFITKHICFCSCFILWFFLAVTHFNYYAFNFSRVAVPGCIIFLHVLYILFVTEGNDIETFICGIKNKKKYGIVISILLAVYFFEILPLLNFLGNIDEFGMHTVIEIIFSGIIPCCICIGISTILCLLGKYKCIINSYSLIIVFFIFNAILFPINYGIISGFSFDMETQIYNVDVSYVIRDIAFGILALTLLFCLNHKVFSAIIAVLVLSSSCQVVYNFCNVKVANHEKQLKCERYTLDDEILTMHSFSKTKPNVVYIVADMFNSVYLNKIMTEISEFEDVFEGFVFYENTLSISGWTHTSLGALYAGDDYSPLNYKKNGISVQSGIYAAKKKFQQTYENAGFRFSFVDNISTIYSTSPYLKYYCQLNNIPEVEQSKRSILRMLPFFQLVPTVLKSYIYDNSNWLLKSQIQAIQFNRLNALKSLSYLELLPKLSSSNSETSNFLYFRSELPHSPYGIDMNGDLIQNDFPDTVNKSFTSSIAAYYSAKKFIFYIIDFINWLKKENLYNNTLIVICSDHGNNCFDNSIPLINKNDLYGEKIAKSRSNALFLIKDLNDNAKFYIDSSTMKSNADIAAMIADRLGIEHDFRCHTKNNVRSFSYMHNEQELKNDIVDINYLNYTVDGSIFEASSWKKNE